MGTNARENILMQLGDYCTNHLCKNCPIEKIAEEYDHSCPEVFRIPAVANYISEMLKHKRTHKERMKDYEAGL